MKYNLKEHPQIFLFLISILMLGLSIFLNILYGWKIYAVILIVIAGLAALVLGYSFFADLYHFEKKKAQYLMEEEKKRNEKHDGE